MTATVDARPLMKESISGLSKQDFASYWCEKKNASAYPEIDAQYLAPLFIESVMENRFSFCGEQHQLSSPIDWLQNPSNDVEWHILLHKFYYAIGMARCYQNTRMERYVERFQEFVLSWIRQTPVGFIATDVTGRRIQNWVYAYYIFAVESRATGFKSSFWHEFLVSLSHQVEFVISNLAPARNHRTLELYSIFLTATVFFEYRDAECWRNFALKELVRNIDSDLFDDGVHCEASSDYHHIVLKNYLLAYRLMRVNDISVPESYSARLEKGLEYAMHLHRPDGRIPALSDADSRSYLELLRQGADLFQREDFRFVATRGEEGTPPDQRCSFFPEGGYYIQRSDWSHKNRAHHLVFDCGPLGQGNHGHLDALSVELSIHGRAQIVDPGRYTYDEPAPDSEDVNWRVLFRSTPYHNTITVDKKNQARYEYYRRKFKITGAPPQCSLIEGSEGDVDYLHGSVTSAEYDAAHERHILFVEQKYWLICDSLNATNRHDYDLRFHLTPEADQRPEVISREDANLVLLPDMVLLQPTGQSVCLELGYVARQYGEKEPAAVLSTRLSGVNRRFLSIAIPLDEKGNVPPVYLHWDEDRGFCQLRHALDGEVFVDTFLVQDEFMPFQFDAFSFNGRALFLRTDSQGRVRKTWLSEGSSLEVSVGDCT